MQTKKDIQALLAGAGTHPKKRFGQCFLIDLNLLTKMVDAAELGGQETVLEVGPGTGSLTEELLARAGHVVAVEIDTHLADVVRRHFAGREKLTLIEGDVLAGKHVISPAVLKAVAPNGSLVANLPYNIATPLVAECLIESWRSLRGPGVRFDRLTFTVQEELAQRLLAQKGRDYGAVSVLVALLGRAQLGAFIPASAFWPAPKVASRVVRIDFDPTAAERIRDLTLLRRVLEMAFSQRRKRIQATARARGAPVSPAQFSDALTRANVDGGARADHVSPDEYLRLVEALYEEIGSRKNDE